VKPEFDEYAGSYDDLLDDPAKRRFTSDPAYFVERKLEVLLGLLSRIGREPSGLRWLDVGCGRGEFIRAGLPHVASAVGCDVSPAMIEQSGSTPTVLQTDAGRLPFADGSCDLVTAVCVYHHVEPSDRGALVAETVRVLSHGGLAVVFEHNPWNPVTQLVVRRTPIDQNAQLLSAGLTRRLFAGGGLAPLGVQHFLFAPASLHKRARWIEPALAWLPFGGQYAIVGRKP
jgi:SAM-dependent methyltransferase